MSQYIRMDKLLNGRIRYYLVEGHREGKKVVQKRLKYLGKQKPSLDEAKRLYNKEARGAGVTPSRRKTKPHNLK